MDKSLYARLDLYECAVVSDENYLTLNLVTDLDIRIEAIPRMSGKLLQTESDSLLLLVEVENYDLDLLIKFCLLYTSDAADE